MRKAPELDLFQFSATFENQGKTIPAQYLGSMSHQEGFVSSSMIWSVNEGMSFTPESRCHDNLYFILEGNGTYRYNDYELSFSPGTVIQIGAGESFCLTQVSSKTIVVQRQVRIPFLQ